MLHFRGDSGRENISDIQWSVMSITSKILYTASCKMSFWASSISKFLFYHLHYVLLYGWSTASKVSKWSWLLIYFTPMLIRKCWLHSLSTFWSFMLACIIFIHKPTFFIHSTQKDRMGSRAVDVQFVPACSLKTSTSRKINFPGCL